jgi:hypothetical protein
MSCAFFLQARAKSDIYGYLVRKKLLRPEILLELMDGNLMILCELMPQKVNPTYSA